MLPSIAIEGTLTKDPALSFTASGVAVATVNVAVNERKKDEFGNYVNGDASFYTCNVWRTQAENVAESLHKGDTVVVIGKFKMRSWEKDGVKKSAPEIEVESIGLSLRWESVPSNDKKQPSKTIESDPWSAAPF